MSGSVSTENRAEPNLTPILDMVFQLITFFMLVINFKAAALDMSLKLPAVGLAKPVEIKGQELIVLNINSQGEMMSLGREIRDMPNYIASEASAVLLAANKYNAKLKPGDELPATVVIRADRKTPFRYVNAVITRCQENGFRQFSLRAMNRSDDQ